MSRLTSKPGVLGWSRLSDPERLEAMTRWSMYVVLALAPWMVVTILANSEDWHGAGGPVLLGVALTQMLVGAVTLSSSLDLRLGRGRVRSGRYVAFGVTTAAALAISALWFPGTANYPDFAIMVHILLAVGLGAFAPLLGWRAIGVLALVLGLAWALASWAMGAWEGPVVLGGLVTATVLFFVGASMRSSVWMIRVFWDQERRRELDARLAVAEERLSFSRDLHDTVGRTLATVAVKSELAAELASRGREGAAEEMLEVRQIAEDALREVRELVAGFRAPDLAAELAGARSLLGSAGIAVSVTADDAELPPATQEALAWVVREAVTNVVRHSDAARCEIVLRVESGDPPSSAYALLSVVNDGAREGGRPGTGLLGLSERLERVGGELDVHREGAEFRLVARVPLEKGEVA